MTIEIVDGQSKRLYSLVAPLVMNRQVLHQNHDYPFWTSPAHIWFIALEGQKDVRAFFPVKITKKGEAEINNYFMAGAEATAFQPLIKEIIAYCRRKYTLQAVVLMPHRDLFKAAGFHITKEWRLYVKMEYGRKRKEEKPEKAAKTAKAAKTTKTAKPATAAQASRMKSGKTTPKSKAAPKRKTTARASRK
ncbi:MAG: hypothetical protein NC048_01250 [Bacteroides sp.]|nr:hypothetical protein [Ruminococcus flavefaciens]MCM1554106.1 hypothetical protein [Bacteroides sp.]